MCGEKGGSTVELNIQHILLLNYNFFKINWSLKRDCMGGGAENYPSGQGAGLDSW